MTVNLKRRPFRIKDHNDYQLFAQKIIRRDDFHCRVPKCRTQMTTSVFSWQSALTVHHIKKRSLGGEDTFDNCITLCLDHHRMNEDGKLKIGGDADRPIFDYRKSGKKD